MHVMRASYTSHPHKHQSPQVGKHRASELVAPSSRRGAAQQIGGRYFAGALKAGYDPYISLDSHREGC